jgi:IS30 family transposase
MKKYKQLSFEDLVKIETLMEEDFKPTEIAIKLSKDKSCIYRCLVWVRYPKFCK